MRTFATSAVVAAIAASILLSSCATYTGQTSDPNDPNHTRTGALIGAGIGADSCSQYVYDHEGCAIGYGALGLIAGATTAVIVDAAVLARELVPARARPRHVRVHADAKWRRSDSRRAILVARVRQKVFSYASAQFSDGESDWISPCGSRSRACVRRTRRSGTRSPCRRARPC